MKHSIKVGFNFGTTSAIITTLGLMVGLYSSVGSRLAIIGGIITIAVADAFSDALGIHISEEDEGKHTQKEIWESTFSTFFFKFIFASVFLIPFLIFNIKIAVIVSIIFGFFLLGIFSYRLSKKQKKSNPWNIIIEHLFIACLVIIITYIVGVIVNKIFI